MMTQKAPTYKKKKETKPLVAVCDSPAKLKMPKLVVQDDSDFSGLPVETKTRKPALLVYDSPASVPNPTKKYKKRNTGRITTCKESKANETNDRGSFKTYKEKTHDKVEGTVAKTNSLKGKKSVRFFSIVQEIRRPVDEDRAPSGPAPESTLLPKSPFNSHGGHKDDDWLDLSLHIRKTNSERAICIKEGEVVEDDDASSLLWYTNEEIAQEMRDISKIASYLDKEERNPNHKIPPSMCVRGLESKTKRGRRRLKKVRDAAKYAVFAQQIPSHEVLRYSRNPFRDDSPITLMEDDIARAYIVYTKPAQHLAYRIGLQDHEDAYCSKSN